PARPRRPRRAMTRARLLRLGLLVAVLLALVLVRYKTAFGAALSTAHVRPLVQHAGAAGVVLFVLAFCAGGLLHVPGLVFVAAAVLAWGRVLGGAAAYAGALTAVSVVFVVVRAIGGQPLGAVTQPRLRGLIARAERRPILTVALLRLV